MVFPRQNLLSAFISALGCRIAEATAGPLVALQNENEPPKKWSAQDG
jgi:hypothetical protein